MPRGPKSEKRPLTRSATAVHVMRVAIGEIEDKVSSPHDEGKTRLRHYPQRAIAPLGQENRPPADTSGPSQSHNGRHAPTGNHSKALRRDLQICRGNPAGALVGLQLIGDLLAFVESVDSGSL